MLKQHWIVRRLAPDCSRIELAELPEEQDAVRLLHSMGYRYRLHCQKLPGKPDLVFAGRRKVIFVHGCFWHSHDCKRGARVPSTRQDYWLAKVGRNKERDAEHLSSLEQAGWSVLTVWECELKDRVALSARFDEFLGGPSSSGLPPEALSGRTS